MNALEFAINMEIDGENYYRKQAENNKGSSIEIVLLKLAKDEKWHSELLRKELEDAFYELIEHDELSNTVNIFKKQGDIQSLKDVPEQLDIYRIALQNEKKSIDMYKDFFQKTNEDSEKNLFKFLIEEEEKHFRIIEDIVLELNKPYDWVESAEFGLRKDDY